MNFTAVEILPALLNKTKVCTTRKAFKIEIEIIDVMNGQPVEKENIVERPSKYQTGDIVNAVWDKDSESNYFNSKNGKEIIGFKDAILRLEKEINNGEGKGFFYKTLGKVRIKSVEKIKISKDTSGLHKPKYFISVQDSDGEFNDILEKPFAKKEGFESVEIMFRWFEKYADLTTGKEFWTYSLEWI